MGSKTKHRTGMTKPNVMSNRLCFGVTCAPNCLRQNPCGRRGETACAGRKSGSYMFPLSRRPHAREGSRGSASKSELGRLVQRAVLVADDEARHGRRLVEQQD